MSYSDAARVNAWIGWITLYTDANPRAWGAYARGHEDLPRVGPQPRVEGSGSFGRRPLDVTLAECRAAIEGCRMALRYWQGVEGIGIRTDSQAAILVLEWPRLNAPHRRADLRAAQEEMRSVLGPVRHRMIWVKGHRDPGRDARAWLNHRADRRASAARGG